MPKTRQPQSIPKDILAGYTDSVQALAGQLRDFILATNPSAVKQAYSKWQAIGCLHPNCGYYYAIFPQNEHAQLGFEWGALLPDPDFLLEGTGKQLRYVTITSQATIPSAPIKLLLNAATELPRERNVKMGIIQSMA